MRSLLTVSAALLAAAVIMFMMSCGAAEEPKAKTADGDLPKGEVKLDAPNAEAEKPPEPPDMKKVSYCVGLEMGRSVTKAEVALDVEEFTAGLKDGMGGAAGRFTKEEMEKIMMSFQQAMMTQQGEKAKKLGEENQKKGADFLAQNAKKEGVKTTASGLQYRAIKAGAATGKQPKAEDTVTVHYKGKFPDGTQFDSSYERGEPAVFEVGGVIAGWSEALLMMREGDVWELVVPSALAYGERGRPGIPPNSVLVFEVELQKVEAAKPPETPEAPKPPEAPK